MVDKKYIVKLQGKEFVLFSGLMDLAHKQGLKSIKTEIIDRCEDVCIVQATVEGEKGFFNGIGDAGPHNVGKMIVPHIIRMAETRAIARALRFYTNIGMTAFEELDEVSKEDEDKGERFRFGPMRGKYVADAELKDADLLGEQIRWAKTKPNLSNYLAECEQQLKKVMEGK